MKYFSDLGFCLKSVRTNVLKLEINPDGEPLQDGDGIDISNPFGDSISILVIDRVLENQTGTYTCMADNPVGHDEFDAKLVVNGQNKS